MSGYCKDCAAGALHGGNPTGIVKEVHGLPCYVAEPANGQEPKGIIVILSDAFGWDLVNNRILADNYASKGGFKVLLPDFFLGHSMRHDLLYSIENALDGNQNWLSSRIPSGFRTAAGFLPWIFFTRQSVTKPRVYDFFRALRAETSLPIGAAGFCWGGFNVTTMAYGPEYSDAKTSDGKALIDAGFTAHPSLLTIPTHIEPIRLPYSVAHGTKDHNITPPKAAEFKKALEGKQDVEFVEYEGAKHGFAVRGDPDDEVEKRQGMEAEEQALRWFEKHLTNRSKL